MIATKFVLLLAISTAAVTAEDDTSEPDVTEENETSQPDTEFPDVLPVFDPCWERWSTCYAPLERYWLDDTNGSLIVYRETPWETQCSDRLSVIECHEALRSEAGCAEELGDWVDESLEQKKQWHKFSCKDNFEGFSESLQCQFSKDIQEPQIECYSSVVYNDRDSCWTQDELFDCFEPILDKLPECSGSKIKATFRGIIEEVHRQEDCESRKASENNKDDDEDDTASESEDKKFMKLFRMF